MDFTCWSRMWPFSHNLAPAASVGKDWAEKRHRRGLYDRQKIIIMDVACCWLWVLHVRSSIFWFSAAVSLFFMNVKLQTKNFKLAFDTAGCVLTSSTHANVNSYLSTTLLVTIELNFPLSLLDLWQDKWNGWEEQSKVDKDTMLHLPWNVSPRFL